MTLTEYLDAIAEKLGVSGLPDRLLTTYLEAFAKKDGVDVSALPDRLASTYLNAILKAKGVQPVKDNLLTTQLAALAGAYGATDFPDNLVSTYLKAIAGGESGFNGVITEVLMEEQSVTASQVVEGGMCFVDITEQMPDYGMADGETYRITVDSVAYRCEVWGHPFDGTMKYVGDGRLFSSIDEELANHHPEDVPFAVYNEYVEGDPFWGIEGYLNWTLYLTDTNTHTIKIERETVIPKTEIVVTGNESFNFQAADSTVYYKNSALANVPHENIVYAECTHLKWGSGAVIAQMNDKEFIFNYTAATGIGTGNTSFKDEDLFTSANAAKEWFKAQAENGTPVTITVYVKE